MTAHIDQSPGTPPEVVDRIRSRYVDHYADTVTYDLCIWISPDDDQKICERNGFTEAVTGPWQEVLLDRDESDRRAVAAVVADHTTTRNTIGVQSVATRFVVSGVTHLAPDRGFATDDD